jgi:hypothetical protein
MKARHLLLATVLALVPTSRTRPAAAQATGDDADTSMARARFKEGVGFFDKGEYEKARASFKQAYALKKHPSVLLNLAWSCVKGAHVVEGERYFQQLLSDKDLTDKQRADATDGLAQARAKLGRIEVSAPPGTEVTIDGDREGATPVEPVWVEPGAHTVKLRSGDNAQTMSVSVTVGEKALARYLAKTAPPGVGGAAPPPPSESPHENPPPAPAASAEAPPKPEEETPPKQPPHEEKEQAAHEGGGAFSPPNNLLPVFVFGGVAVASFAGAGVALYFKGQAQNSANQVASNIQNHQGYYSGICNRPPSNFRSACDEFIADDNDVNQDATAGNVMLGVGIAATAGGLLYWLLADKKHPSVTVSGSVAPQLRGLVVSGEF